MKRGNGIQVSDSGQRDACVSARSRGSRMDSVGLPRILLRCRFLGLMPEPGTWPLPRVLVGLQAQVRGALTPRAARLSAAGPPGDRISLASLLLPDEDSEPITGDAHLQQKETPHRTLSQRKGRVSVQRGEAFQGECRPVRW